MMCPASRGEGGGGRGGKDGATTIINNTRSKGAGAAAAAKVAKMVTEKLPPGTLCVVCQDVATGKHYSVPSCNGCKTFFRRAVVNKRQFTCMGGEGKCPVDDKSVRCACRHCRLMKCLAMGMDTSYIQSDRDRIGYTKRTRKQPPLLQNGHLSGSSSSSCLPLPSAAAVGNITMGSVARHHQSTSFPSNKRSTGALPVSSSPLSLAENGVGGGLKKREDPHEATFSRGGNYRFGEERLSHHQHPHQANNGLTWAGGKTSPATAATAPTGGAVVQREEHDALLERLTRLENNFSLLLSRGEIDTYASLEEALKAASRFSRPIDVRLSDPIVTPLTDSDTTNTPPKKLDLLKGGEETNKLCSGGSSSDAPPPQKRQQQPFWRKRIIALYIDWAKMFPTFRKLPYTDKVALITNHASSYMIMCEAFRTPELTSEERLQLSAGGGGGGGGSSSRIHHHGGGGNKERKVRISAGGTGGSHSHLKPATGGIAPPPFILTVQHCGGGGGGGDAGDGVEQNFTHHQHPSLAASSSAASSIAPFSVVGGGGIAPIACASSPRMSSHHSPSSPSTRIHEEISAAAVAAAAPVASSHFEQGCQNNKHSSPALLMGGGDGGGSSSTMGSSLTKSMENNSNNTNSNNPTQLHALFDMRSVDSPTTKNRPLTGQISPAMRSAITELPSALDYPSVATLCGLTTVMTAMIDCVMKPFRRLNISTTEFATLQAIMFFDPDTEGLDAASQRNVAQMQKKMISALYSYIQRNYEPESIAEERYIAILLRIPMIRKVAAKKNEALRMIDMFNIFSLNALVKETTLGPRYGAMALAAFHGGGGGSDNSCIGSSGAGSGGGAAPMTLMPPSTSFTAASSSLGPIGSSPSSASPPFSFGPSDSNHHQLLHAQAHLAAAVADANGGGGDHSLLGSVASADSRHKQHHPYHHHYAPPSSSISNHHLARTPPGPLSSTLSTSSSHQHISSFSSSTNATSSSPSFAFNNYLHHRHHHRQQQPSSSASFKTPQRNGGGGGGLASSTSATSASSAVAATAAATPTPSAMMDWD